MTTDISGPAGCGLFGRDGANREGPQAVVGVLLFNHSVGIAPDAGLWDLLDRLDAAATDAQLVHHDLCTVFRDDEPCSCGYPQLLIDAAQFVRSLAVEDAVGQAQRAA